MFSENPLSTVGSELTQVFSCPLLGCTQAAPLVMMVGGESPLSLYQVPSR